MQRSRGPGKWRECEVLLADLVPGAVKPVEWEQRFRRVQDACARLRNLPPIPRAVRSSESHLSLVAR